MNVPANGKLEVQGGTKISDFERTTRGDLTTQ